MRLILSVLLLLLKVSASASPGSEKKCQEKCGDIEIKPPFGLTEGCFRPGFRLICNKIQKPRLFLGNEGASNIEVTSISFNPPRLYVQYYPIASSTASNSSWELLKNTPYTFSSDPDDNRFTVVGCDALAELVDLTSSSSTDKQVTSACSATCQSDDDPTEAIRYGCVGIGCCQMLSPKGLQSYQIRFNSLNNLNTSWKWRNSTSWAFVGQLNDESISYVDDMMDAILQGKSMSVNAVLLWMIRDKLSCNEAKKDTESYACADSAYCQENEDSAFGQGGYNCFCPDGEDGNPYDKAQGCRGREVVTEPSLNCPTECGKLRIPFPFGIGSGCYRGTGFNLTCDRHAKPNKLIFSNSDFGDMTVVNITLDEGKLTVEEKLNEYNLSHSGATFLNKGQVLREWLWMIDYVPCKKARLDKTTYACRSIYSECYEAGAEGKGNVGYRCKCTQGYAGNPYISGGCKDIDECKNPHAYGCFGKCKNEQGSYRCTKRSYVLLGMIIGMSSGIGFLLLIVSSYYLNQRWKEMTARRIRDKHFHKNRGLLLQQLISTDKHLAERTKIFSLEELQKATNNFDVARILGQGGHGTVYKGILSDQRVAAIKKANIAEQKEIDEFINEVVILSQINHRNVLKLFGCCLESEIPLLVYQFVSNGTLKEHLERHSLSWQDRLRIASEASGALAHLHSSTSISIFHRDVKSSNILLDDNCMAKVSDFGASRALPPDQSHLTTAVQGTLGYLDPEYYQTGQLTNKSDVYSFGIILVELLTGEKPTASRFVEGINMRNRFLLAVRENQISQILEERVMREATEEEINTVSMLADMCLSLRGEERPTMKEVEMELEGLRRPKSQTLQYEYNEKLPSEQSSAYHELEAARYGRESESLELSRRVSIEKELMWSLDWPR